MKKWKHLVGQYDQQPLNTNNDSIQNSSLYRKKDSFKKYTPARISQNKTQQIIKEGESNQGTPKQNSRNKQRFIRHSQSFNNSNSNKYLYQPTTPQVVHNIQNIKYKNIKTEYEDSSDQSTPLIKKLDLNESKSNKYVEAYTERTPENHNMKKSEIQRWRTERRHDRKMTEIDTAYEPNIIPINKREQRMLQLENLSKIKQKVLNLRNSKLHIMNKMRFYTEEFNKDVQEIRNFLEKQTTKNKQDEKNKYILEAYHEYSGRIEELQQQKKILLESMQKI